ncbi:MAG: DUF503 domain-containing protein [Candidatus Omnitrophica bacterium]|nr:DUF503 domain-containing protein [Candidatus Omnitrophota bacterium]
MRVGILRITLEITDSLSLKDKRMVIRSLKDRLRQRYNISVAEVDDHDAWQRSTLGLSMVSHDREFLDATLNKITDYIEKERSAVVLGIEREVL